MVGEWKLLVQKLASSCGLQIRRLEKNVHLHDAFEEQKRIIGRDATVILEVGAADGRDCETYSQHFTKARIYAFEPVPESFAEIQKRTTTFPSIVAFNEAMSDEPGTAEFHIANWNDASSLLKPMKTGSTFDQYIHSDKSIQVKVNTIDRFCQDSSIERIHLLKMDAQGAELRILHGADRMLAEERIDVIYSEVMFLQSYEGAARYDQIMQFLDRYGFRLHNLYELAHNQKGELTQADAIFIHRRISR